MNNKSDGVAKLTRFMIMLMTILLSAGTVPAQAGLLDRINSKVNTINSKASTINSRVASVQSRTASIMTNTDGLQELVTNVRGVTSGFRPDVFKEIQARMGETQDLVEFLRTRGDSAGSYTDYPDLMVLITSLESVVNALLRDNPDGVDFGVLSQLLEILPDRSLATLARTVSKSGVDAAFVDRVNQAALDLVVLIDAIKEDEAAESAVTRARVSSSAPVPGTDALPFGSSCDAFNSRRRQLKIIAGGVLAHGGTVRLLGEIMAGMAKTVQTQEKVGIHGYVGLHIKTEPGAAVGKVLAGIGTAEMAVAGTVFRKLKHCEILYHQQEILVSNQAVLDSNQILLQEICSLGRYRSAACQALRP